MNFLDRKDNFYPISLELYHKMLSIDQELEKTELFEGVIVKKMTKGTEHNYYVDSLFEALKEIKPLNTIIRSEKTLSLGSSELEPDISVIEGSLKNYFFSHPKTAILVVEVSISSIAYDRQKIPIYARANIQNYWILDGINKVIEVYSKPENGNYNEYNIYSHEDSISIFGGSIDLSPIFSIEIL